MHGVYLACYKKIRVFLLFFIRGRVGILQFVARLNGCRGLLRYVCFNGRRMTGVMLVVSVLRLGLFVMPVRVMGVFVMPVLDVLVVGVFVMPVLDVLIVAVFVMPVLDMLIVAVFVMPVLVVLVVTVFVMPVRVVLVNIVVPMPQFFQGWKALVSVDPVFKLFESALEVRHYLPPSMEFMRLITRKKRILVMPAPTAASVKAKSGDSRMSQTMDITTL
jgi:hypothetical protein